MERYLLRGTQIFIDFFLLSSAFWLSFLLRFEFSMNLDLWKLSFFTWPYVVMLQYFAMVLFSVPKMSWRYVSVKDAARILIALGSATVVLVALRLGMAHAAGYTKYVKLPLGILAMDFAMSFLFITGVRVLRRSMDEREERFRAGRASLKPQKRTLLIGAGRAGVSVAKEVMQNPALGMKIVGFLDDDKAKIGTAILGSSVLGDTASLKTIVSKFAVEQAVITIASVRGTDIRRILSLCEAVSLPVKIIPCMHEILDGRVNLSGIRNVTLEDLLGREAVELDVPSIAAFIKGKRVLITGAGGSIGAELARQSMRYEPSVLILLEQAENPLFEIHREMSALLTSPLFSHRGNTVIVPCIADICDEARIHTVFETHRPEVVFHAAAHKHVPMMEWNPGEAVKNNVFGTKHTADAADQFGVDAFVLISTDKAVNPVSVMGAAKRAAELYIQSKAGRSKTKFAAVRFGNVLGSAGSVIPLFTEQIRNGGPVTVTHKEMKRYFMTIPEACSLVMQAAVMGTGGEIFVLDMGEPVKIVDLARDLIRLSGFTAEEMPIEFTQIRPGEKLFEELSLSGEQMTKTRHPKIYIGQIEAKSAEFVQNGLAALSAVCESESIENVRKALLALVPEMSTPEA
jgi:FlaA1/EpsC-like NDP-sugar epimerase